MEVVEYDYKTAKVVTQFYYYIDSKKMNCIVPTCDNYADYLNIIKEEIQKINK